MYRKLKENIPLIIVIFILTLSGFLSLLSFKDNNEKDYQRMMKYYEDCQKGQGEYFICDKLTEPPVYRDTFSTFGELFSNTLLLGILELFAPFLIIFASIFSFHKKIRKSYIKNSLTRISYKKYMINEYLKTIKKYAFIYPIFIAIILFCCFLLSGNFDVMKSKTIYHNYWFNLSDSSNIYIFIPSFLLNFVFSSIFWINIGIYNCKKNEKSFIAYIISCIEYILIFATFETFSKIQIFSGTVFNELFALATIYTYIETPMFQMNLFTFLLASISTLIVYLNYCNKEKYLIEVGI